MTLRNLIGFAATAIRLRNAALNFSFLHRLAINLFRTNTSRFISLPKKRKAAPGTLAISLQY
jgi:hypothetical protein